MAIRGFSINISDQLSSHQAATFAQWIGASNVMRNQKQSEFLTLLKAGKGEFINQAYSHIRRDPQFPFLKDIPVQLMRNAASQIYTDTEACRKGIRQFPKPKGKSKKRSALITQELFTLESLGEHKTQLTIFNNATQKRQKLFSVQLPYLPEQLAKQIRISRLGRKFTLSSSYSDGLVRPTNTELLLSYVDWDDAALLTQITGIDRGVKLPACTSEGTHYAYSPSQIEKLKAIAKKKARYQRILARKKRLNGNKNKYRCESRTQQKLAEKISSLDGKTAHIRDNFCHTISKQIVLAAKPIIALEDLTLKNMTRRAKPKRDRSGRRFVKNQGHAKSGLNRSLLNVALGKLGTFITYKASDQFKATAEVPAFNTSKECHVCHDINTIRPDQATLICLNGCGTFHADENAGEVIAYRAVSWIKEYKFAEKAKPRKTTTRKKTVSLSPPVQELASDKSGRAETAFSDALLAS